MVSYERIEEFFREIIGLEISQGTLASFPNTLYAELENWEETQIEKIINSYLNYSDETGVRVGGKTNRIHTICNQDISLYFGHQKRGKQAIDDIDILTKYTGYLVHDHWFSYEKLMDIVHIYCNAHHLRELDWVIENEKKDWAIQMKELIHKAKSIVDEAKLKGKKCLSNNNIIEINQ